MLLLQLGISSQFSPRVLAINDLAWMLAAFLSVLLPDDIFPSGGFSSNRVNWVKPVQESDKSLHPSMFQSSSMRRSCFTSQFVLAVLETSMYFSGKIDSGFNVMAVYEVFWHGPKVIYRFTGIRKWVLRWWKRPFWFSKKIYVTFSSNWVFPYRGGCSQVLISSKKFDSSICDWKK